MSLSPKSWPNRVAVAAVGGTAALLLAGLYLKWTTLAAGVMAMARGVDSTVLMLFGPVCALVFIIVIEVVRIALRGALPSAETRVRPIRHWNPGRGEG